MHMCTLSSVTFFDVMFKKPEWFLEVQLERIAEKQNSFKLMSLQAKFI